MNTVIELNNISKTFGKKNAQVKALREVSLKVQENEVVAIVGKSGSGKSTLLNIIGCMDRLDSGQYMLGETNIETLKDRELAKIRNEFFGYVMQDYALIGDMSVQKNIEMPLKYAKKSKRSKEKISRYAKELGIEDKLQSKVENLSGGQKQRVAIARALINDAKVILADEPTGALDAQTGEDVFQLLLSYKKEGKSVVIVTHNEELAKRCDRIIKLGDGKIIEE
ncbi:ABC transporter ATP-binding protein [Eubacterium oxidoreducens]|uniref:Putative ABC transport system ATP-binding protein n=1 Tax=Eubacterium oxidoreducens TaxID=1732 RepID=A0A1G6A470_EUBOX|nr:ABC transporter ATP-binding protein [Eubacterium oxidoreducens]SDB03175.1 putative ABC transport system ATP-binding protein [Eubacterium oxidoreducens]